MMKKCVVNFACKGRENYLAGQARLRESLQVHEPLVPRMLYESTYPVGCPSHQEVPYAFKWYLMQEAFDQEIDLVLWLDASVVVLKPLDPLWEIIRYRGILVFDNPGCPEHFFTSKDCLDKMGCSMEEAHKINQVSAGMVGFNKHNEQAMEIFRKMLELSKDGVSFQGGSNTSPFPHFKGHRHDQSCLSYLTHKAGIVREPFKGVRYSGDVVPETILELRGM